MSKQAQRNQQKRAAKCDAKAAEEAANAGPVRTSSASSGDLWQTALSLARGSCIVEYAPKLVDFLKENGEAKPSKESKEPAEGDEGEKEEPVAEATASSTFALLVSRMAWMNSLGLAEPKNAEDAVGKWQQMRKLEVDGGPRKSKRGSPSFDRIVVNFSQFLPQYFHALLVLAMLHAFLFRSYFACLPWLVLWQTVSLLIPLETMEKVPQVPLSQCPVKFRVAATLALNGLMLLFFAWELLWRMNFFVKFLVVGLLTLHAHSVKPLAA